MKYLNPSFSVNMPGKMMKGTCERCVFGRGVHMKGCKDADSKGDKKTQDRKSR